jgi:dipeptidyl aminopeptidase/acylaminoacyl peptidase
VLVEALGDPLARAPWTVAARLTVEETLRQRLNSSVSAEHALRPTDLFDVDSPHALALSADGELLAVGLRHPVPNAEHGRSWVDVYDVASRELRLSLEGIGDPTGFAWSPLPADHRFAFVRRSEEKANLWLGDADGAPHRLLLENIERFGGFRWTPDGRSLIYSVAQEAEKDPEGVKRYRGLTDRWSGSREKSHLYQLSLASGIARRLTAGTLSTSLEDIAPGSDRILFSRTRHDDATWPFARTELFELELNTLELRPVTEASWGLSARYDSEGARLLILASPMAFGGIGRAVPDSVMPNLYDTQLYLFDLEDAAVDPITRDFDPSIDEAVWSQRDGRIYARATRGSQRKLFRYDLGKRRWEELETEIEVVGRMDISANGERLALEGSSTNTPSRIYVGSIRGRFRPDLVWSTDPDRFDRIRFGKVEDFDFSAADGTAIAGRVYFPPDFDSSRRYPAIVYYYGGTSPVTRNFGGRYPKELWAANDYVVYVLQPSGATGFGQQFSARHVNNWGRTVAEEIIDGTKAFLMTHPFVDPARVGCIGASYGGFMTQLLVTRSDLFAAAISHAGISSISSYWGEGNWGYIYSAAATAQSYPWNRPDVYVEQSPLFAADKIRTPLLLLHGGDDDNVPPGESEQLYSALRVLGREVEYVRIEGERHWILSYEKRKLWTSTIVAWFDRWLKGEPQWWEQLYAKPGETSSE